MPSAVFEPNSLWNLVEDPVEAMMTFKLFGNYTARSYSAITKSATLRALFTWKYRVPAHRVKSALGTLYMCCYPYRPP